MEKWERDQARKQKYNKDLEAVGSLWTDVDTALQGCTTDAQKDMGLEVQLRFYKFVLSYSNKGNILCLSRHNKPLTLEELPDNGDEPPSFHEIRGSMRWISSLWGLDCSNVRLL